MKQFLSQNGQLTDLSDASCKVFVEQQLTNDAYRKMAGQPFGNTAYVVAVVAAKSTTLQSTRNAPNKPTASIMQLAFVSFKVLCLLFVLEPVKCYRHAECRHCYDGL